ncbi:MAG: PQQ-dependent sugar dehydrogenase [Gemmatimonadales bacterium]|nr:MAG: PQQ-dependent sugar dehydrogenase [Gemmatimonadales bacterium]
MSSHARRLPAVTLALAGALLLSACETPDAEAARETGDTVFQSEHHAYRLATVVDGLQHPWALAFLPGGDMLVTERGERAPDGRPGQLRIVRDGRLLPDPVPGLPTIRVGGQGGLLDVILHPDFETNQFVYLSYSKPNDDDSMGTTAVARGRLENDALHDVEDILIAEAWVEGRGHHGSRLAFDADGYLFVTVGDRQVRPVGDLEAHPAQDPADHIGTTLRIHDDGGVPADNPFVGEEGVLPEIWSWGHRNAQGMAIHPETNEVWQNEHGPQGGDELNLIKPGVNYGWPVVGFGVNYGPGTPIHEAVRMQGMEDPVHHWTPSIATSGLMIYTGDAFPRWQGDFFSGGLAGQQLSRVRVVDGRAVTVETLVPEQGRIRDVRQGPDGLIYLVMEDRVGEPTPILRMEPADQD